MIGVRNQENLIEEVVAGLVHSDYPTSWNLVVPPGFGEDGLGDQIAARVREHSSNPVLAILSSDEVQGVDMYARELHRQWSETIQVPGPAQGEATEAFLRRLLSSLPTERPAIQVLKRFHKVLDSLESWVLGLLRGYERNHRLLTVTISPYSYEELKKRWRRLGHLLTASNYGDTHSVYSVELLSPSDILDICRANGIPDHISQYALDLTGGYPEPFNELIAFWMRMQKPPLQPDVKIKFRKAAEQHLRRFVEWL